MTTPSSPERRQSLAQRAYLVIRERILCFDLRPGSTVIATQLARELGMSQTPVHQALQMLCADRLAQVIPRVGYVITPITVSDVQEVFQLRLALEPLAVDLAVRRASDAELEAFRIAVGERRVSATAARPGVTDRRRAVSAGGDHDHFHLAVAAMSGQGRLVEIIGDLLQQGQRMFAVSAMGAVAIDPVGNQHRPRGAHRQIAEAILARDSATAVDAMAAHVRTAHRRAVEGLVALDSEELKSGRRPRILN